MFYNTKSLHPHTGKIMSAIFTCFTSNAVAKCTHRLTTYSLKYCIEPIFLFRFVPGIAAYKLYYTQTISFKLLKFDTWLRRPLLKYEPMSVTAGITRGSHT